MYYIEIESH